MTGAYVAPVQAEAAGLRLHLHNGLIHYRAPHDMPARVLNDLLTELRIRRDEVRDLLRVRLADTRLTYAPERLA